MTVGIMVEGNYEKYSDAEWVALNSGDLDARPAVLRHVIKALSEKNAQAVDEYAFLSDISDALNDVIAERQAYIAKLETEKKMSWESKPSRRKKSS